MNQNLKPKIKNYKLKTEKFWFLAASLIFLFFIFGFPIRAQTFKYKGIDMLWEANTYTPYQYKGKALITPLSSVKITAIPHIFYGGRRLSKNELFFDWFLNDNWIKEKSGKGRNSFIVKSPILYTKKTSIKVWVSDASKTFKKIETITISNNHPKILIYQYDSFRKTISRVEVLAGEKKEFIAEPYFIPKESFKNITYRWIMNGGELKNEKPFNILNFKSDIDMRGNAFINVNIKFNDLLESIKKSFVINVI
jgi:hypothetical protein